MSRPRVSIGVPVYNGERFLSVTLDSLIAQTFHDFEVVVCDNASTDATADIIRDYCRQDRRFRYVRNEANIGATPNFNRVVALAEAPLFKLANADDVADPNLLALCVPELDRDRDAVLCFGQTTLIDTDGRTLKPYQDGLRLSDARPSDRLARLLENIGLVNALQGVCRRDALMKVGRSDTWVGADLVLLAKMALAGRFIALPQTLLYRRMHDAAFSSLTDAVSRQAYEDPARGASRLARWRVLGGYAKAIAASDISRWEKICSVRVLGRWARHNRDKLLPELLAALRS